MKPKKRTYNTRRIRLGASYSVQEVSKLFGVHKNAVLKWVKDGLSPIDKHRPYLLYGRDLAAYLNTKQGNRKHKCKPDEFFCFKCRVPRRPWGNLVDIVIRNEIRLNLSALCGACGTVMNRAGAARKLSEYQKIFTAQSKRDERITACPSPSVTCDIGKDAARDELHP
ncbi:MAG: DNA-binding protein [Alphaproteobacteria bacterium]|nr:MAG: DNA-binding protein [Alphaproteobacteria bacterium]